MHSRLRRSEAGNRLIYKKPNQPITLANDQPANRRIKTAIKKSNQRSDHDSQYDYLTCWNDSSRSPSREMESLA